MAYIANQLSGDVNVIDLFFGKTIATISTGDWHRDIAINSNTNIVYVTNKNSDNIIIIDGLRNKIIKTISVGKSPFNIAVNPETDNVYVTKMESNTVSVIDGTINEVILPENISFSIMPSNSGYIECNNREYPTNQFFKIPFGVKCVAEPNKGFQFSSWTQDLGNNLNKTISASTSSDSPIDLFLNLLDIIKLIKLHIWT
jgi:YVTN family beta-propeller protein